MESLAKEIEVLGIPDVMPMLFGYPFFEFESQPFFDEYHVPRANISSFNSISNWSYRCKTKEQGNRSKLRPSHTTTSNKDTIFSKPSNTINPRKSYVFPPLRLQTHENPKNPMHSLLQHYKPMKTLKTICVHIAKAWKMFAIKKVPKYWVFI